MASPKLSSIVRKILGKEKKKQEEPARDAERPEEAEAAPPPSVPQQPAPDAAARRLSDGPGTASSASSDRPTASKSAKSISSPAPRAAKSATGAKRVRRSFVYDGYGYVWYPNERLIYITMGPDYRRRSPWLEVRPGSRSYDPIAKQYELAKQRKESGRYPELDVGATDALTGGAVSRLVSSLMQTDWYASAKGNAVKTLSSAGGEYTTEIADAVMQFQNFAGLEGDGVVGEMTHDAVLKHAIRSDAATSSRTASREPIRVTSPEQVVDAVKRMGWDGLSTNPDRKIIVVDGKAQEVTLRKVADNSVLMRFPCSTAKMGFSNVSGGLHGGTATGLMRVVMKAGDGEPMYTVFVWKKPYIDEKTGQKLVLKGPNDGKTAYVLTRVIVLDGMQEENKLTYERNIYMHGTNREANLGRPDSGGCIRVSNENIIKLFDAVSESDLVYVLSNPTSKTPPLQPNEDAMKGREFDDAIRQYYASRGGRR